MSKQLLKQPASLGELQFLCSIDRTATYSYDVPQYVIDSGNGTAYVNVIKSPLTISMTVFESSMPVTWNSYLTGSKEKANRVQNVKEALLDMYLSDSAFKLTTPDEVYENMVITGITFPEEKYQDAMEISITLKQVIQTETELIVVDTYEYSGDSDDDVGTLDTSDADESTSSANTSVSQMTTYEYLASSGVDFDNGISASTAQVDSFGSYSGTGNGGIQDSYVSAIISAAQSGLLEDCLFINPNYGAQLGINYLYVYYDGCFYKTELEPSEAVLKTLTTEGYTVIGEGKSYSYYTTIEDYLASK